MTIDLTKAAESPEEEYAPLKDFITELFLAPGECLFQEGSQEDDLYLIRKGRLEVLKGEVPLGLLETGDFAGEVSSFFRAVPKSTSAYAKEEVVVWKLPTSKFSEVDRESPGMSLKVMEGLLRTAGSIKPQEREHAEEKSQAAVRFLSYQLAGLALFCFLLEIFRQSQVILKISCFFSIALILFFLAWNLLLVRSYSYPLSVYGISGKDWKKKSLEAIVWTIPLAVSFPVLKWIAIQIFQVPQDRPFFYLLQLMEMGLTPLDWVVLTCGYALLVPVQEFIARGCMQGLLEKFFVGRRGAFMALLLSNLLFSASHLILSLKIAAVVFFVGLFWGWMYSRQRTLVGVIVSHVILGLWGGVIVGYP